MIKKVKKYPLIKYLFFPALFLYCLTACSQNVPEVKTVNTMTIFDFSNEIDFPSARLSFFVEAESDVKRADSLEVYSTKYGYSWKSSNLIKIATSKKQWAGYSNFAFPETLSIPDGNFVIKYTDAEGESTETNTYISFDSKFLTAKALEVPELMNDKRGKLNVAVFDKDNKLIIYGDKSKDLRSEDSIKRKYKDAYYYREVWITGNNSTLCLMPLVYMNKKD